MFWRHDGFHVWALFGGLYLWFHVARMTSHVKISIYTFSLIISICTFLFYFHPQWHLHIWSACESLTCKNITHGWKILSCSWEMGSVPTTLHSMKKRLGLQLEWLLFLLCFIFNHFHLSQLWLEDNKCHIQYIQYTSFVSQQLVKSPRRIYFQLDRGQLIFSGAALVVLTAHPLRSPRGHIPQK